MAEFVQDDQPLHPDYPLPDVDDPVMRPFWDGARDGQADAAARPRDRRDGAGRRSRSTGRAATGSSGSRRAARGASTPTSWRTSRSCPPCSHLLPHIMVVVELAEGARIVGHMVRCTPEEMRFDLPVRVVFKRLTDRVTLPVWEPDR